MALFFMALTRTKTATLDHLIGGDVASVFRNAPRWHVITSLGYGGWSRQFQIRSECLPQSFDFSSGLFSFGFTVERTTINLFSMSNQNGAPSEIANAVNSQPNRCDRNGGYHREKKLPSQKCKPGHSSSFQPMGKPRSVIW